MISKLVFIKKIKENKSQIFNKSILNDKTNNFTFVSSRHFHFFLLGFCARVHRPVDSLRRVESTRVSAKECVRKRRKNPGKKRKRKKEREGDNRLKEKFSSHSRTRISGTFSLSISLSRAISSVRKAPQVNLIENNLAHELCQNGKNSY